MKHAFPREDVARYLDQSLSRKTTFISDVLSLNEREKKILSMRFGLNGYVESTLQQTGDIIGVGRERVRQIEAKALEKIRIIKNKGFHD